MRTEYNGRLFKMATVAISDCQPQDGQGDFNSLVFTTNRTSSKQKEIYSMAIHKISGGLILIKKSKIKHLLSEMTNVSSAAWIPYCESLIAGDVIIVRSIYVVLICNSIKVWLKKISR
jgi:hypothetical protein